MCRICEQSPSRVGKRDHQLQNGVKHWETRLKWGGTPSHFCISVVSGRVHWEKKGKVVSFDFLGCALRLSFVIRFVAGLMRRFKWRIFRWSSRGWDVGGLGGPGPRLERCWLLRQKWTLCRQGTWRAQCDWERLGRFGHGWREEILDLATKIRWDLVSAKNALRDLWVFEYEGMVWYDAFDS